MNYETAVKIKQYIPNVVILFKGYHWGIRQPDSGLTIDANRLSVEQVAINPTKVDPFQANTTINSYTFKLIDKDYSVTLLFDGITKFFQNEAVEIYVGRCGVDMPFADYMKLPTTYVTSVSKDGSSYSFRSTEAKERLNRPAFNEKNKLQVNILPGTTEIDADALIDPLKYPTSGMIKIEDEFISYASIDLVNNRFSGCIRGEESSVPASHSLGETIYLVDEIEGNPLDIILQCLVSSGGGGSYDVLSDGAGVDQALINVAAFETIRDEFYAGINYRFLVYGISNILTFLEEEILFPNELRIISDNSSLISIAVLNRRIFDPDFPVIDNTSIQKQPDYEVNDAEIINVISIEYDYSEALKVYRKLFLLEDQDSITDFGRRDPLELKLKGVSEINNGAAIATNIAQRFLSRFSYPKPEISFTTHMDKSLVQLCEKIELNSNQLPNVDTGDLNFAETLEVIERGINWKTGDVRFKVAFTSFTGIRECFLAPSDAVTYGASHYIVNVGAGRGALYRPGWKMRLYSETTREYYSAQVNEILSISGDVITFVDPWLDTYADDNLMYDEGGLLLLENGYQITLTSGVINADDLRIMFADYDQVSELQKRYCFISDDGLNFTDSKKSYQITL